MRRLNAVLVALTVVFLTLAAYGHDSPAVRDAICRLTKQCPDPELYRAWFKTAYEIGLGGLLSMVFYWLLVWLPEHRKRRRIKRTFERQYRAFKKDCIMVFLGLAHGTYSLDMVDGLLDQKAFREHFGQYATEGQDYWCRFLNELDDERLRELLTYMEVFRDQISFVLNNTDIRSDEPFEFFQHLSSAIYCSKDTTLDYDSTKRFSRFLWSIFAGFSFVGGYRDHDVIERMIRQI